MRQDEVVLRLHGELGRHLLKNGALDHGVELDVEGSEVIGRFHVDLVHWLARTGKVE